MGGRVAGDDVEAGLRRQVMDAVAEQDLGVRYAVEVEVALGEAGGADVAVDEDGAAALGQPRRDEADDAAAAAEVEHARRRRHAQRLDQQSRTGIDAAGGEDAGQREQPQLVAADALDRQLRLHASTIARACGLKPTVQIVPRD
jgi:hypothetical protein